MGCFALCRHCKSEFEPTASQCKSYDWRCKQCRNVYGRSYRKLNPEKRKAIENRFRERNREKLRAYGRSRYSPELGRRKNYSAKNLAYRVSAEWKAVQQLWHAKKSYGPEFGPAAAACLQLKQKLRERNECEKAER